MDPVMQSLFGKMPIEQLTAVQAATTKNNNANAILFLGGVAIVLGFTAYYYYKQNEEIKVKIKIIDPKSRN
jgi:hypothetical protein